MEEAASTLTRRFRRKELTLGQAQEAFRLLERRRPLLADESGLLQSALALALRRQLSLWDCLYLALAMERMVAAGMLKTSPLIDSVAANT